MPVMPMMIAGMMVKKDLIDVVTWADIVAQSPPRHRPASISASEANAVAASCMKRDSIEPSG
jgi:hypothetical protein